VPIVDPITLAALGATGLAAVGALPQLCRLARTGDTTGVSLAHATLGVGSELGWLAYTSGQSLWSAVPEAVLMVVVNLLLARALVRAGAAPGRPVAAAMLWSSTLIAATALGGWGLLGTILPLAYGVQVAPSVWSAYRAWMPSGVAAATWALILFESVLWGIYGFARRDPALLLFGVIGSCSSAAILVRVVLTRGRVRAVHASALHQIDTVSPSEPQVELSSSQ
jgi:hypothetical protein